MCRPMSVSVTFTTVKGEEDGDRGRKQRGERRKGERVSAISPQIPMGLVKMGARLLSTQRMSACVDIGQCLLTYLLLFCAQRKFVTRRTGARRINEGSCVGGDGNWRRLVKTLRSFGATWGVNFATPINLAISFLPRDAMPARCPVVVCLSACPSFTSRYCIKTAKRSITQTTPHNSPGTLGFLMPKIFVKFKWGHPNGGAR